MTEPILTVIKPLITEKTVKLAERGKYSFIVDPHSKKATIKRALKEMYGVDVGSVNISVIKSKRVRVFKFWKYRKIGFQNLYKKAVVTIKKGREKIAALFRL